MPPRPKLTTNPEPEERDRPNVADPLSEPTLHRRVWACYLHRGYTRAAFARALGTSWSVVQTWDLARSPNGGMSLASLIKVARVLGYTTDELCFGHQPPVGREPVLDASGIMKALAECNASAAARAAFAEHLTTTAARYQEVTRSYVHAWVGGWAAHAGSASPEDEALIAAVNARARAKAVVDARPLPADALSASDALGSRSAPSITVKADPGRTRRERR